MDCITAHDFIVKINVQYVFHNVLLMLLIFHIFPDTFV